MAAKFVDDNKPNLHLKSEFALIQFHLICKILAKLSGAEYERAVSEFRKRKRNFWCYVHQLHKRVREIKKFQVADVYRGLRNAHKTLMHVKRCCFANLYRLLFCCSRCRLLFSFRYVNPCFFYYFHFHPSDLP